MYRYERRPTSLADILCYLAERGVIVPGGELEAAGRGGGKGDRQGEEEGDGRESCSADSTHGRDGCEREAGERDARSLEAACPRRVGRRRKRRKKSKRVARVRRLVGASALQQAVLPSLWTLAPSLGTRAHDPLSSSLAFSSSSTSSPSLPPHLLSLLRFRAHRSPSATSPDLLHPANATAVLSKRRNSSNVWRSSR